MFSLEQVRGIIHDIFTTELVKQRQDTFAFFDTQAALHLSQIPPEVRAQATAQVGAFFGFQPRAFSSLEELAAQAASAYQTNRFVYLSTSGSTGVPKQILHTQEMMEIEGKSVGYHFRHNKRFITLTPRQHLYGLSFAVFFSSLYKIPSVSKAPLPLLPWETILQNGDALAGFPLFWDYFLQAGHRFPTGVTAVTSTAPCPRGLNRPARSAWWNSTVQPIRAALACARTKTSRFKSTIFGKLIRRRKHPSSAEKA